ncbi:argonaute-like protein [Laetiporus sulphureus 93-53]|uniref:Argonaute-like protein n=1 Tax=Laetiporus sulphureus 93-53 TaxID=1314785 RepID=A0A165BZL9_9APHY|nr:argonaute-like protein [Laetiporus sulphureus 93-53]KZT01938.1 argonaute-like protein [Laetiporus sulphureus 93-53]
MSNRGQSRGGGRGRGGGGRGGAGSPAGRGSPAPGRGAQPTGSALLRANFKAVRTTKKTLFDYEVVIEPKGKAARADRKARIMQLLEEHPEYRPHVGYVAHDQAQRLISAAKLPQPLSMQVQYREEGENTARDNAMIFTVDIKFKRELDMAPLDNYMSGRPESETYDTLPLVSALNLVLQQHAQRNGFRVGKNRYFFRASSERQALSLGVEAWRGFFISVRPMYKQLMVNVNVCMTAFYTPGNLAVAMEEFQRNTGGGMPRAFAEKLRVATTHLGYARKKAILRITNQTPKQARFDCQELGGMVTVEEYFKRKYKITLRHPNLPVVDIGSKQKPNLIPPELCEIFPGQAYRGKLSPTETAEMIKYACNPPIVNAMSIRDQGMPDLGLNPASNTLNGFEVSVSTEMTVIPSRVLPPPAITYQTGRPSPRDGSWNILNVKFHVGGNMSNWAVLLVQEGRRDEFSGTNDPDLMPFLRTFSEKCRSSGMNVGQGPPKVMATGKLPPPNRDSNRRQALEQIRQTLISNLDRNKKPSFILVLLSGVDNFIYPGIKRLGDVDMGLHTVHMLLNKARGDPRRPNPGKQDQYFSNVALKVNIKLGGINHKLDQNAMSWLTKSKTMVVGIDVTHPGPSSAKGTPSIAAVVASIDNNFVHYPASLSPQKPDWNRDAKEMVENLSAMMIERLQLWQKKNKSLPDRVIIFRDGVSEARGQYDLVIQEELPRILDAFKRVSPSYRPKLTITICGKRHHARFFPTDKKDASKNGNTLPGTVVDKGITDVYGFDWYLQAHSGLQGHVRPTHYYVVYDDSQFSADTLQQGTHTASYLYARATKAVSLVPPAYYADLACERARYYLNTLLNLADQQSSTGGSTSGRLSDEEERQRNFDEAIKMWGNGIHSDLKESMFYI